MSLNAPTLGAAIASKLGTALPGVIVPGPDTNAFCNAIAEAVVEHLQANAVVTPTALVAPSGGGPVTGTGKVT